MTTDTRRILLDGCTAVVTRDGDELVASDGRRVAAATAIHLPPVEPTKIICCHLNHVSRVHEFGVSLPPAPTYFHKPVSALNSHGAAVVRPSNCDWLNYEGEVAIVIGRTCRNVSYGDAGDYIGQGRTYNLSPATGNFGVSGSAGFELASTIS